MGGAERIIFALRPLGEAGQAAPLAQSANAVAPPGQDFVRIGLVPDVPDDAVARRIENLMQGQGEFDDAEPGAQMPASNRNGADRFGAQLIGESTKIALGHGA